MSKILVLIPARYASTRFPGKALVDIGGQPMVWQVYLRCLEAKFEHIFVATDDIRIFDAVESRGGKAIMTKVEHESGTDRCAEALLQLQAKGLHFDYVLNVQGDEPFVAPEQLQALAAGLEVNKICTLAKVIESGEQVQNPNVVKVAWSKNTQEALYFSRYGIPYWRGQGNPIKHHTFYKHIGLYGFDAKRLVQLAQLPASPLEKAESLEQLRWMENGHRIKIIETNLETKGIDSPEDLEQALKNWKK